MSSLVDLNSLIATTGPHYVRCLKPNALNRCEDFDPKLLSGQLKCNGVLEAVKVTRSGFSNRFPHRDFLRTFSVGELLLLRGRTVTLTNRTHPQEHHP